MNRNVRVPFLLVSLLSLLIFVLLFALRSADDNRLTSWQWVFEGTRGAGVFLALIGAVLLAFFLSRVSFPLPGPAVSLFVFSFCIGALFWSEPEMIVDASRYFTQAKHLEVYGAGYFFREWGRAVPSWTDLPLIPFLYGCIFRFLGESRTLVQIFTTLLFSFTVVLTYLIGKALWGKSTGLTGGLLMLGMPYLFTQVPLMLVDVPTMFFLTLSILAFLKGIERGGMMIAAASFSLFLAIFSKYSTWPMLSVLVIIIFVFLKESPRSALPAGGGGQAAVRTGKGEMVEACEIHEAGEMKVSDRKTVLFRGTAIIAIALLMSAALVLLKYSAFLEQVRLLMTFQGPGLKKWGETFTSTFLFQVHPFVTLAGVFSFYAAFKKRDLRYVIVCWLFVLLVLFQVKRIRYTVPLFPMVALMGSYGLGYTKDREVRRFVVLCAVMSSLTVAFFGYLPFLKSVSMVNLKNAGEFIDTLKGDKVEVFTVVGKDPVLNPAVTVPLLDFFTGKKVLYHYTPSGALPSHEDFRKSPLRFTWEYKNPAYYEDRGGEMKDVPVVVLSEGPAGVLPQDLQGRLKGYRLVREFATCEGVFSFRTSATVYEPGDIH